MSLLLELTRSTSIPLEIEGITPDKVRDLSRAEIENLEVFEGNQKTRLGEFFAVSGTPDDEEMRFRGDLSGVHWVGAKMKSGRIVAEGNLGRHVGSEMSGGTIDVAGNVGDWVGAEMIDGTVHVKGKAGHLVGAAYRGSAKGMTGGTILIEGDAGNEIGHTMRRGLIAIGGNTGDLIGFNMLAGTILVAGETGIRHGAGMKRGTLVFLDKRPELLPTFSSAGRQSPLVMTLLRRQLESLAFSKATHVAGDFELFHGDLLEGGRGEVMVRV